MSVVKITNHNPYDWIGTKCFIDGKAVPRVRSIDFHVAVDEIPVFEFEMAAWRNLQWLQIKPKIGFRILQLLWNAI